MAKRRSLYKEDNKRPPSLYRKESNRRGPSYNRGSGQTKISFARILSGIFTWIRRNPKLARNIFLIFILLLAAFLVLSHIPNGNDNASETSAKTTPLGNNSLGNVHKEGPYGNTKSNVSIAYILGVHPRENGAHRLMEQAFKENADSLNCSYYIYKINVTESPTSAIISLQRLTCIIVMVIGELKDLFSLQTRIILYPTSLDMPLQIISHGLPTLHLQTHQVRSM